MTAGNERVAPGLRRVLGLARLTAYGVGNLVGAGYYALMGEVTGMAGALAPLAFLLAAVVASFSALSFGEWAARYPLSGGPASYARVLFGRRCAAAIGVLMLITGTVSAATLASAVDGFLQPRAPHPPWMGLVPLIVALAAVAVWGISESVWLAVSITVIEVGGLVLVGIACAGAEGHGHSLATAIDAHLVWGLTSAAFLAFYAFVGFEDLVTLAEETRRPRKTVPRAIVLSLAITTLLYVVVTSLALRVVPPEELARTRVPMALVAERAGLGSGAVLSYIGVLAGLNGALVQLVMGARVIHGLTVGSKRWRRLGRIHPLTRTPLLATSLVAASTLALALWFDVVALARTTSFALLIVFGVVDLALVRLKRRDGASAPGIWCVPGWVPAVGGMLCAAFLLVELARQLSAGR